MAVPLGIMDPQGPTQRQKQSSVIIRDGAEGGSWSIYGGMMQIWTQHGLGAQAKGPDFFLLFAKRLDRTWVEQLCTENKEENESVWNCSWKSWGVQLRAALLKE